MLGEACCNSSAGRRKSSGAMCSLSVYSAFIRHPVAQAAFWKAVFIGAFLFMLRGGRSALAALCWIWSIRLHRKTLCVRYMREVECVSWDLSDAASLKSQLTLVLSGFYCRKQILSGTHRYETHHPCYCLCVCLRHCFAEEVIMAVFSQHLHQQQPKNKQTTHRCPWYT